MSGIWGVSRRHRRDSVALPRQAAASSSAGWFGDGDGDGQEAASHRWLVGDQSAVERWLSIAGPRSLGVLSGHPRLRGPFTAAGSLARNLAPGLLAHHPELVRGYGAEILTAAPDLAWMLGPRSAGNHHHDRTRQAAEGLAALTLAYAQATGVRQTLAVLDADALDPSDATWLAGLITQSDPARLEIVVAGATADVPAPLSAVLAWRATRTNVARPRVRKALGAPPSDRLLARAYVASECLSDDPAHRVAYAGLDPAERAAMHDVRAARLELVGEPSLRLGAIPYHRERGSQAAAGVAALTYAITQCFKAGWYDAAVAFGDRLRDLLGNGDGSFAVPAGA